jgi:site-specific recombinase XerD
LGNAANTRRAWRAGWRVWVAFCAETNTARLPATVNALRAFLQARIAAGIQRATLELNLSTLAMVHRLAGLPWPLNTLEGKLMWRAMRRALPTTRRQKRGLSINDVKRMLAPLNPAVPRDARDGALLSVAYETQLRRSEVVALNLDQVRWEPDGAATVLIQGRVKKISVGTTQWLRHWLTIAGLSEGALFRTTPTSNQPGRFATRLSDRDVARIYKRRAVSVGLDATEIAGHSTRIGAVQDLLAAGYTSAEVMREVGWSCARTLSRYTEHLQPQGDAMARLVARRASGGDEQDAAKVAARERDRWPLQSVSREVPDDSAAPNAEDDSPTFGGRAQ